MRVLANLVIAVFTAGMIGLAFAASSFITPYLWLPVAYGLIVGAWIGILPAIKERKLGVLVSISFAAIAAAIWARSEGLLNVGAHARTSRRYFLIWIVALGIASLFLAISWLAKLKGTRNMLGWLAVAILLAALIAQTSNASAGATGMVDWVMARFHWDRDTAERIVIDIRKGIHLSFYGFVAFAAWRGALQARAERPGALAFSFGFALILASFDELRQSTQIGRSGSAWDVALDMIGAATILGIAYLVSVPKSPAPTLAKSAK